MHVNKLQTVGGCVTRNNDERNGAFEHRKKVFVMSSASEIFAIKIVKKSRGRYGICQYLYPPY